MSITVGLLRSNMVALLLLGKSCRLPLVESTWDLFHLSSYAPSILFILFYFFWALDKVASSSCSTYPSSIYSQLSCERKLIFIFTNQKIILFPHRKQEMKVVGLTYFGCLDLPLPLLPLGLIFPSQHKRLRAWSLLK